MSGNYDDIIGLPHPTSARHLRMPLTDRAAQFSPFAALSGYDEAVKETARLTQRRIELDESVKEELDRKLRRLESLGKEAPPVTVTYFLQDPRKEGGAYITVTGRVKKFHRHCQGMELEDGTEIYFSDILRLN